MKKKIIVFTALVLTLLTGCEMAVTEDTESSGYSEIVTSAETSKIQTETEETGEEETAAEDTETVTDTAEEESSEVQETTWIDFDEDSYVEYHFRNQKLLNQHFEKHGGEFADDFGYKNAEEYEKGASDVINNSAALYKTEAEDGDGVYYIESTNEFVVLSTDGYIRTYFRPNKGIEYFNKQ